MKLDLGGTACYESADAVSVSLDGTTSDDVVSQNTIGDYRMLAFLDNSFDEAFGSCILEEEDEEYHQIYAEILRVLKPGALLIAKGCGGGHVNHLQHALDVGFELVKEGYVYVDPDTGDCWYDTPFIFKKPS